MQITISIPRTRITDKLANYLWGCKNKVRYGHAQTAENAVRAMAAKGVDGLEKYRCGFCGGWHVGHSR